MVDRDLVLKKQLTRSMRNLAGFRNIVVHGYEDVSLGIVRDIVRNRLPDLLGFAAAIGDWLGRRQGDTPATGEIE